MARCAYVVLGSRGRKPSMRSFAPTSAGLRKALKAGRTRNLAFAMVSLQCSDRTTNVAYCRNGRCESFHKAR